MEADSLSVSEALCRMQSAIKRGEIDEAVLFGRRTHRSLSLSDEDVTFGPLLCEGAESRVFQGTFGPHSVAIKKPILRTSFDLERFRGEIEILFKMNHPSIVSILGARMLPPNYYLVMPFEGKSFHSLLYDDGGRTNWKRTLEIGLQLTSAMQHVHDHGILHRDLKTRNVMIGKDGVAKLIDFGIAKSMELVATEAQKQPSGGFHKKRMMGTLEYMAPEVLQNQGHSSASDVYAFAILLNEMMTGIYPFSDCNKENPDAHTVLEMGYGRKELAAAVAAEGLRPTLPKDAPLEYVDIISKCWSLYPSKRPTFAQIHDHLFSIWTKLDTIAIPLGISSKKSSYSCLPLQKKIEIDSFEADSKNGGWSKVSEGTEFTVTLSCGSFQTAGHRGEDKMEDRHLIVTPFLESESNALFGVFDGHRGSETAQFAVEHFHDIFRKKLQKTDSAENAFISTFYEIETLFEASQNSCIDEPRGMRFPGCTAITALVLQNKLFIANAGDCRAILCRNGKALQISRDHTAMDDEERSRVQKQGSNVHWTQNSWRIGDAGIQITRSLGDVDLKSNGVCALPEIASFDLSPSDAFLIIGSDGLWDTVNNQDAVYLVLDTVKNPDMCAKRLATQALTNGSMDNITVVVVFLTPVETIERVYVEGESNRETFRSAVRLSSVAFDEISETL